MRLITWCLIISLISFSCSNVKRKYLIPEKVLVPLLVDLHLADGIGVTHRVLDLPENLDSTALYNSVFDKHGVTRLQFDSTMTYYTNHPKTLDKIYEKVIENLSRLESELKDMEKEELMRRGVVIFRDNKNYKLPSDGKTSRIGFETPVSGLGNYTIYAKIKVYEDDESIEPRINVFFWYDNGTKEGYKNYFRRVKIKKDNILNSYTVSKNLVNKKVTHIKGYIYDHTEQDTLFTKHAYITGIRIEYLSQ
jgi:hypothetical protein